MESKRLLRFLIGSMVGFLLWFFVVLFAGYESFASAGFGDAFAPFTAFLVTFTIWFTLRAIKLQSDEFSVSRKEEKNYRYELIEEKKTLDIEIDISKVELEIVEAEFELSVALGKITLGNPGQQRIESQKNSCVSFLKYIEKWSLVLEDCYKQLDLDNIEISVDEKGSNPITQKSFPDKIVVGVAIISFLMLLIWIGVVLKLNPEGHEIGTGRFGDAFGAFIGFLTALGLGLNLYALHQQKIELGSAVTELIRQRKTLESQNMTRHFKISIQIRRIFSDVYSKLTEFLVYQGRNINDEEIKELSHRCLDVLNSLKSKITGDIVVN